ncbi:MAG: ISNCY family transposase [Clostridia bacterium]|nr:ISNCY family transposase [Clostridia bacterium]
MLRLKDPQLTTWDIMLPAELLELKEELAKVDVLLDDESFMEPFIARFNTRIGRPTVPVETYLRLMYLKFRYQLGYEVLVEEVKDSIQWRLFCRISLGKKVPHSTTLIKLTKRYGPDIIANLNAILINKARDQKIIRGRKLRLDTTAVEADIHHPTDASLLSDGVRVITRTVKKIKAAGIAIRTKFQDRRRSVKKRILSITKVVKRRTGEAYSEVRQITGEIMTTAQQVVAEAKQVLKNAKQYLYRHKDDLTRNIQQVVQSLTQTIAHTEQIISQTVKVQQGQFRIPERMVSIFDLNARPIKRGKLHAPTEFGYKILLQETEEKVITGYQVLEGNPSDDTLLVNAVDHHIETFKRPPWAVATDRGFGSTKNEKALKERGVKRCSLPFKGKLSKTRKEHQSQNWFKRLQRWRAGGEATISVLKRKYGLRRSRFRGACGTKSWVGLGIMAYNLRKIATLM